MEQQNTLAKKVCCLFIKSKTSSVFDGGRCIRIKCACIIPRAVSFFTSCYDDKKIFFTLTLHLVLLPMKRRKSSIQTKQRKKRFLCKSTNLQHKKHRNFVAFLCYTCHYWQSIIKMLLFWKKCLHGWPRSTEIHILLPYIANSNFPRTSGDHPLLNTWDVAPTQNFSLPTWFYFKFSGEPCNDCMIAVDHSQLWQIVMTDRDTSFICINPFSGLKCRSCCCIECSILNFQSCY